MRLNKPSLRCLQLETLIGKAKAIGLNVEERYGSGKDVVKWFENKEYDKIIKHLKLIWRLSGL